ncbi:hypothetical protein JCM14467A_11520 [Vulcanisaeta sp. JCM 14467]
MKSVETAAAIITTAVVMSSVFDLETMVIKSNVRTDFKKVPWVFSEGGSSGVECCGCYCG